METLRQAKILCQKSLLQKLRSPGFSLSEILVPVLFICFLSWLKSLDPDESFSAESFDCRRQNSFSPTLFLPQQNDENVVFEIATDFAGKSGIQTTPPLLYLLALMSRTHSVIALVPNATDDFEVMNFISDFHRHVSKLTHDLKSFEWGIASTFFAKEIGFGFCAFDQISVKYDNYSEYSSYLKSLDYGKMKWDEHRDCPSRLDGFDEMKHRNPRVHIALVVNSVQRESFESYSNVDFTIETNVSIVPPTYKEFDFVNPFGISGRSPSNNQYLMSGFATLQLLVNRFIVNEKVSNSILTPIGRKLSYASRQQLCNGFIPGLNELLNVSDLNQTKLVMSLGEKMNVGASKSDYIKQLLDVVPCETILLVLMKLFGLSESPLSLPISYIPNNIDFLLFPTPDRVTRPFYLKIKDVFALLLLVSYNYTLSRMIRGIVTEKENKSRVQMVVMGVEIHSIFFSWVGVGLGFTLLTSFTGAFLGTMIFSLVEKSSFVLVFLLFFLFGCCLLSFSLLISVFFSRAKTAAISSVSISFMMFFPYFFLTRPNGHIALSTMRSCLIFAPTAFGLGASVMATFEAANEGVTFSTLFKPPAANFVSFFDVLVALLADAVGYFLLALVFEQFIDQEHGVRENNFKKFFCSDGKKKIDDYSPLPEFAEKENSFEKSEPPIASQIKLVQQKRCVEIRNLVKKYKSADKPAVNDVSVQMFEHEIFTLLGPNGAGKSTTMSILTGLVAPTSGSVKVFGLDITTELSKVRALIGLCQQDDVLFEGLTTFEHFEFFARLRKDDTKRELLESKLKELDLFHCRNTLAESLSGGEKRKLSTLIAYTGNPKLVVLDEVTSGIDVVARRQIWKFIQKNKIGRVTLLSTHYMDEAQIVSDRICFLRDGELAICGSLLFIKQAFDVGYQFEIKDNLAQVEKLFKQFALPFSAAPLNKKVLSVPIDASRCFPYFLSKLKKVSLFKMRLTSLDEVFRRINQTLSSKLEQSRSSVSNEKKHQTSHQKKRPLMVLTTALFTKRLQSTKRDFRAISCNTLLPMVLLLVGLLIMSISIIEQPPRLDLSISNFHQENMDVPFFFDKNTSVAQSFEKSVSDVSDINPVDVEATDFVEQKLMCDSSNSTVTNDRLQNVSAYLLHHREDKSNSAFGAFDIQGADSGTELVDVTILVNSTARHGVPTFLNLITMGFNSMKEPSTNRTLNIASKPFEFTKETTTVLDNFLSTSVVGMVIIAYTFVPANVIVTAVKEKEIGFKSLQRTSANNRQFLAAYWGANFLFDFFSFLVTLFITIFLVGVFSVDAIFKHFISVEALAFACLLVFYALAVIPFSYLCSFLFSSHTNAQNFILLFSYITGYVLVIASFIMSLLEATKSLNEKLLFVFRIFPGFALGEGVQHLCARNSLLNILHELGLPTDFGKDGPTLKIMSNVSTPKVDLGSPFHLDNIGWSLIYLFAESIIYSALVMWMEKEHFEREAEKNNTLQTKTSDVDDEEANCIRAEDDDVINVKHLVKSFEGAERNAVDDISFCLKSGEITGLLGFNGAGKSTTLKILVQEHKPTSGRVTILSDEKTIGYCPQHHCLLEHLTVQEHLELFSQLTLLEVNDVVVIDMLRALNLEEYANVQSWKLSGGNKRKLQVALAFIGRPSVVILDEPSCGMDIENRRFLWNILLDLNKNQSDIKKTTTLITSHSMEEAEALCSKLVILQKGKIRCDGSLASLKAKYAQGFNINLTFSEAPPNAETISQFFEERSVDIEIIDQTSVVKVHMLPRKEVELSAVFTVLEDFRTKHGVDEYTVEETTIEQIFLNLHSNNDEIN